MGFGDSCELKEESKRPVKYLSQENVEWVLRDQETTSNHLTRAD